MASEGRAIVRYNLARFGILAAALLVGYLVGLEGILLVAAAILVSAVVSWFLLAGLRGEMIEAVQRKGERWRGRAAESEAREDAYDEERRRRGDAE